MSLYLECEVAGHIPLNLRTNLEYCKKWNPADYVDLIEQFPEEAAKYGHSIPREARTMEEIFEEVKHHKFRVINVINLNTYLITGGVQHGTGPLEGLTFWNAVYIKTSWETGEGCKTTAIGNRRMYALLSTSQEIEDFKQEEINNLAPNETETVCT